MRIKEMISSEEALDHSINSPCQHLSKCIDNSMENMHTDVGMSMVKKKATFLCLKTSDWVLLIATVEISAKYEVEFKMLILS